ncbi:lytic polysaccharide monooxygenase [Amniculicola lignicola CBS 123094]|uniref:AA9 family lytic polysaccharide monooxygenase n=1 Tax=Amniculicola lignicola CBS 123094 TaxID=1392246 RepID=A0A6A5WRT0_9PLEO|nr:lytic polysaccharide monooxygenase [Amniculicola lignicola CBS 123094]
MKISTSLAFAAAASSVSAHTIFVSLNNGAVGDGVRVPSYDGPIVDVSTNDIVCNGGPNPTKATSKVIDVQAGSTAKLTWRHTLTSGANDIIDASHKGPVMAYMKKVSDATKDSGVGGGWFKIQEDGLSGTTWGVDRLISAQGVQTITIPSCIAPGQYLLRGELIALHGASSSKGAQFYMECAQINVVGGTGSKTPATVSFPGAYKQNDPGVLFNLYSGAKTYTIPGPAVFKC